MWIGVAAYVQVYVLVVIVKKQLDLTRSWYVILKSLSLTMFERIPLNRLLASFLPKS